MHVLIFASTASAVDPLTTKLGGDADRHTVAVSWSEVLSTLNDDSPDLILIERAALARVEPTTLLNLMEPGRWPPLVFVDTLVAGAQDVVEVAKRFSPLSPSYRVGDLRIDTRKKRVGLGGRWVTLSPLQYRLLLALAKRAGEVVGYQELFKAVWGYDGEDKEARELLKVHVRQIRRRLGLDPKHRPYLRSVRGFGYMLASPDEE
jgi:DNA-binding response OmpR family regulator